MHGLSATALRASEAMGCAAPRRRTVNRPRADPGMSTSPPRSTIFYQDTSLRIMFIMTTMHIVLAACLISLVTQALTPKPLIRLIRSRTHGAGAGAIFLFLFMPLRYALSSMLPLPALRYYHHYQIHI
jgi:hypothetical protein